MTEQSDKSLDKLMKLLVDAEKPFNEQVVSMDCKDDCEEVAEMAERVAKGEKLEDIFPEYAAHIDLIRCSKEEFEALVSVIKADLSSADDVTE